jgi:hypothetical protein
MFGSGNVRAYCSSFLESAGADFLPFELYSAVFGAYLFKRLEFLVKLGVALLSVPGTNIKAVRSL